MPNLLYIEASPRKQRSASIEVAQAFLGAWRETHAEGAVDTLDVWSMPLPEFDGAALDAKYAGLAGTPLTAVQSRAWAAIRALAARFQRAEHLLFAVPMWNFSIPYRLKHLIDCVTQKDLLFTFDERGLQGALGGRKAVLIYARGIDYGADAATPAATWDLQGRYLELWLRFIGVTDVTTIEVEKTFFGPEVDGPAREAAKARAVEIARGL